MDLCRHGRDVSRCQSSAFYCDSIWTEVEGTEEEEDTSRKRGQVETQASFRTNGRILYPDGSGIWVIVITARCLLCLALYASRFAAGYPRRPARMSGLARSRVYIRVEILKFKH